LAHLRSDQWNLAVEDLDTIELPRTLFVSAHASSQRNYLIGRSAGDGSIAL
jgi:hypothetical protein